MSTLMWILVIGILWMVAGVFSYGITFAHFQRKFSNIAQEFYYKDKGFAILMGICGWISLPIVYFCSKRAKYGLKFK